MSRKKTTIGNIGIVYLFTNDVYEKESTYKFGVTRNPFERKRIQSNSTPPTHSFYDKIILFSSSADKIEFKLRKLFRKKRLLLTGDNGGTEWITGDYKEISNIFMTMLLYYPDSIMCYNGKCYQYKNDGIKERRHPNCRLDLLGIINGDVITCAQDKKKFEVQNNGINVNGIVMTLSKYMQLYHPRYGKTNQHNGYQSFKFKGKCIYDVWQKLVRV